ncbi:hypothetical protein EBF04_11645 [Streptomyces sp. I6]|nr:hypothetical protein EBF04_11645 [Streptomyces sp. I6]
MLFAGFSAKQLFEVATHCGATSVAVQERRVPMVSLPVKGSVLSFCSPVGGFASGPDTWRLSSTACLGSAGSASPKPLAVSLGTFKVSVSPSMLTSARMSRSAVSIR